MVKIVVTDFPSRTFITIISQTLAPYLEILIFSLLSMNSGNTTFSSWVWFRIVCIFVLWLLVYATIFVKFFVSSMAIYENVKQIQWKWWFITWFSLWNQCDSSILLKLQLEFSISYHYLAWIICLMHQFVQIP